MKKDGALTLKNFFSDKCIDNSGSKKRHSIYVQWDCKTSNANQIFYLIKPVDKEAELTKLTVKQKVSMNQFRMPSGYINFLGYTGLWDL